MAILEWIKIIHKSKQTIDLDSVNPNKIVVCDKLKNNDNGFKCFIGYKESEIVRLLCIAFTQMNEYVKYFENGSQNMSFFIREDDDILDKYNKIWNKIQNKLNIKFRSTTIYGEKNWKQN